MNLFQIALIVATFLCSLVAGFLFAFAVVAMPGIRDLGDAEFIRAFQGMDGVIQRNHPVFLLVWLGSVVALLSSVALGIGQLDSLGRLLIVLAALIYLFGVQLPTVTINIPLNNKIQSVDTTEVDEAAQKAARTGFESRWNRWNKIRTVFASLTSVLLIILVLKL